VVDTAHVRIAQVPGAVRPLPLARPRDLDRGAAAVLIEVVEAGYLQRLVDACPDREVEALFAVDQQPVVLAGCRDAGEVRPLYVVAGVGVRAPGLSHALGQHGARAIHDLPGECRALAALDDRDLARPRQVAQLIQAHVRGVQKSATEASGAADQSARAEPLAKRFDHGPVLANRALRSAPDRVS